LARTAFVTGASGFVGANLVRALLADGWQVRALVRSGAPSLDGLDVERVAGDVFAPELCDAMRGCEAVFHAAAFYSLWHRDRAALMRVNVEGTRNVLAAARAARVPRVVHTSSVAAIGVRPDGLAADETYQSEPETLIGAYKRSKYLGELEAHRAAAEGQDVVIVNPATPVGPWDARPTPTGEIIVLSDRPAPRVRLPRAIPLAYAALGEFVLARVGIAPDVSFESVRMAKQMMFYDATKSVTELGLRHRDGTLALEAAVTWFQEHGYAPAGGRRAED
jgi:dihydroflavonol-4-reductase